MRLWEWGSEVRRWPPRLADVALLVSVLGLILGAAVYFYPTKPFLRWGTPTLSDYIHYEVQTQNLGTTGLAEYLPKWVEEIPTSSPLVSVMSDGTSVEKLDRAALPVGVRALALSHTSIEDRYQFKTDAAFRARFLTFYFPGWRAWLDGKPVPIHITSPLGLIAVDIPPGDHELVLRFGETPFRLAMDIISVLGGLALIGLLVTWLRGQAGWRKGREGDQPVAGGRPTQQTWGRLWPLGMLLVLLIAAKVGLVDPHTSWFRRESPPNQVIGAQHPMYVPLEDSVLFLGYDLVGREVIRGGDLLQVRLYWQATGPLSGDYVSFVHLDAPPDNTTFATSDNYVPGDPQAQIDMPSLQWGPTLYVRDEHRLQVPEEIPPIAYALRAGLYDRQTGRRLSIVPGQAEGQSGDTILLQHIHVLPARTPYLSAAQSRHTYHLGESIALLGHRVDAGAAENGFIQPGKEITVTLYWQALEPVIEDYTVFVHLLDEAGQMQSQNDATPVSGRYPTQSWLPRQIVEDETTLTLAPELPSGEYRLAVGMYDLETGQRLPVMGNYGDVINDAIVLETVLHIENRQE